MKYITIFFMIVISISSVLGCNHTEEPESNATIIVSQTSTSPEENQSYTPTTTDPTAPTREEVKRARYIKLKINQSNQEVEPTFSSKFSDYVSTLLTYHGISIAGPSEEYDILLTFNLEAEPLGAVYIGADDLCYTGARISGEVIVTSNQGEPIHYDFYAYKPTYKGTITHCATKKSAPFESAYKVETVEILADLWGAPMHVYAYVFFTEFNAGTYYENGKTGCRQPSVEGHGCFLDESIDDLKAIGTEAVLSLISLLSSNDGQVRWAAAVFLGRIETDVTQAIPYLIECLHDTYVLEACFLNDDDLYPVREAALNSLKMITGQDFGLDEIQWQNWWEANH